jgi:hypothetical protein
MANCALILKISLAMLAFAANSILCRLALLQEATVIPFHSAASGWPVVHSSCHLSCFITQKHIIAVASAERILPHGGRSALSVAYIHPIPGQVRCYFWCRTVAMVIHGLFKGNHSPYAGLRFSVLWQKLLPCCYPGRRHRRFSAHDDRCGLAWAAYSVRGRRARR